jgi:hypothetical protein
MDPVREQLIMFVFELLNEARSPEEVRALFDVISPKRQDSVSKKTEFAFALCHHHLVVRDEEQSESL